MYLDHSYAGIHVVIVFKKKRLKIFIVPVGDCRDNNLIKVKMLITGSTTLDNSFSAHCVVVCIHSFLFSFANLCQGDLVQRGLGPSYKPFFCQILLTTVINHLTNYFSFFL